MKAPYNLINFNDFKLEWTIKLIFFLCNHCSVFITPLFLFFTTLDTLYLLMCTSTLSSFNIHSFQLNEFENVKTYMRMGYFCTYIDVRECI